ncbi:MAG: hypothetical protein HQK54_00965, partial [Oligoflexales bacterium]|nr:hypothetical protein [Oligoflexales bacterium]
ASSGGGSLGVQVPIEGVPLGIDLDGSSSSNYCKDAGSRAAYRKAWYEHNCVNSTTSKDLKNETNRVLRQVDHNIVTAWQSCVLSNQDGFTCNAAKGMDNDTLTLMMLYRPSPQSSAQVNIGFQLFNLTPIDSLPATMGFGTKSVLLRVINPLYGSNIIVTGSGQGPSSGQESCNIETEAYVEKVCSASGDLVAASDSSRIFLKNAAVCTTNIEKCEAGRLRAWIHGDLDDQTGGRGYEMYLAMRQSNKTAFFRNDGTLDGIGPCN